LTEDGQSFDKGSLKNLENSPIVKSIYGYCKRLVEAVESDADCLDAVVSEQAKLVEDGENKEPSQKDWMKLLVASGIISTKFPDAKDIAATM
jgi:hypothetical protein